MKKSCIRDKFRLVASFCLLFISIQALDAQTNVFKHISSSSNIAHNYTIINHPSTNGASNKVLFVMHDFGRGPYIKSPLGIWYTGSNKWSIFNQDLSAMPRGAKFNVLALTTNDRGVFIHTARNSNTSGHITTIDHPMTNNNPNAKIILTQNWGRSGPYNKHVVGVYYSRGKWHIFNQDFARMPIGAKFNILVNHPNSFLHRQSTSSNHIAYLNHSRTNRKPNNFVFATQNWGTSGPYNNHAVGVRYASSSRKWSIYNEDRVRLPRNVKFNILSLEPPVNLNGYYSCNDGGYYYIRQIGKKVYWFGEHASGSWANVFSGELNGSQLTGEFNDVPKGRLTGRGSLRISISNQGASLRKISGAFGGSQWTRQNLPQNVPHPRALAGFQTINNINDLDGNWRGNDNGTYYIRQYGNKVIWFGEKNFSSGHPSWTNVAVGTRSGNRIYLDWADVPKGRTRGSGQLVLGIRNKNELYRIRATGGFGGSFWERGAKEEPNSRLADFGYGRMKVNNKSARGTRPLLVIRLSFRDEVFDPAHSVSYYDRLLFGNGKGQTNPSARNYFKENSVNQFTFGKANILKIIARDDPKTAVNEANIDCFFRRDENCPGVWEDALPQIVRWAESQANFNFSSYDTNRDKVISPDELSILILHAEKPPAHSGAARWVSTGLRRGYKYRGRIAICQERASFSLIVHELSHLLGTLDVYGSRGRNWRMTIMASSYGGGDKRSMSMDPYHRMLLGWVKPRIFNIADQGGAFKVNAINDRGYYLTKDKRPVILYDARKGTHEYFMLESRHNIGTATGFDNSLGASGVAIWRVRTKSNHWPVDSYVIHADDDGRLQSVRRGDDLVIKDKYGKSIEIHSGANNKLDSRVHKQDRKGHDFHLYVVGPPNLTPPLVGYGRPWKESDGLIRSLVWSSGQNSKLKVSVEGNPSRPNYYTVCWNIDSNARSAKQLLAENALSEPIDNPKANSSQDAAFLAIQGIECDHVHEQLGDSEPENLSHTSFGEQARLKNEEPGALIQNYPNPFKNRTTIRYQIPEGISSAEIVITNLLGQRIKVISLSPQKSGEITLSSSDFKTRSGVFLYSLVIDGKISVSKRMVLH